MTEAQRIQGALTQWDRRGFGAVLGKNGKRYFLFHANVENPERLRIGDIVEFVPAPEPDNKYDLVDALCAERTGERLETVTRSGGTGFRREEVTTEALNKFMGE